MMIFLAHFDYRVLISGSIIIFFSLEMLWRKMLCPQWKIMDSSSRVDVIFCACVLFLLFLPISRLNLADKDTRENRTLASFPLFLKKDGRINEEFGTNMEKWLSDRVFGRHRFLQTYNWMERHVVGIQNETKSAILGKEDWIFYKGNNSIKLFQNRIPFTEEQLVTIHHNLMQQKNWLLSMNIDYVVFIAPNKSDVYGEYYPAGIHKIVSQNRVALLSDFLQKEQGSVPIVYPIEELMEHKRDGLLFYKNDTHWTPLGGFYGYRRLMVEVQGLLPEIKILSPADMTMEKAIKATGDLNAMLPNVGTVPYENVLYDIPVSQHGTRYNLSNEDVEGIFKPKGESRIRTVNPYGKYKAIVFRDSFCRAIIPYLSESFHEILYVWVADHQVDSYTDMIIREKPDIVIHEMVSRYAETLISESPHWSLEGDGLH